MLNKTKMKKKKFIIMGLIAIVIVILLISIPGRYLIGSVKQAQYRLELAPLEMEAPLQFKSKFFKEHMPTRINFPIDLNNEPLYIEDELFRDGIAYKLVVPIHMLGFTYGDPTKDFHIQLINKFQRENGATISDQLTKDVFMMIDDQLREREKLFDDFFAEFSAEVYPLFEKISPRVLESKFPKKYIFYLYYYWMKQLPPHLRMENFEELAHCIQANCVGWFTDLNGNEIPYSHGNPIDSSSNFYFVPGIFIEDPQIPVASTRQIHVGLHEYAHALDLIRPENWRDPQYPHYGMLSGIDFYNISHDYNENLTVTGEFDRLCFPLKSADLKDFLTYYSYEDTPPLAIKGRPACPPGYSAAAREELADFFSFWVTAQHNVQQAALQNSIIQQKYDWFYYNVFQGKLYDTDLADTNWLYSGCLDGEKPSPGPGYISCDTSYVWNGLLPQSTEPFYMQEVPTPPPPPPAPTGVTTI